jgi:hypothetical protein
MLMTTERRPAIRTLRGWAISLLQEAGAIRECDEHGWMRDYADPHARQRAVEAARHDPPPGVSPDGGGRGAGSVGFDRRQLPGVPYVGCLGRIILFGVVDERPLASPWIPIRRRERSNIGDPEDRGRESR